MTYKIRSRKKDNDLEFLMFLGHINYIRFVQPSPLGANAKIYLRNYSRVFGVFNYVRDKTDDRFISRIRIERNRTKAESNAIL